MPSEKKFSTGDAISFGWETFKKNYLFFIALTAIYFIVTALPSFDFHVSGHVRTSLNLAKWLIDTLFQIGIITIALKFVDSKKTGFGDFFENIKVYFRFLAGLIIYGLIVFIGLILLIIPGFVWAIKYQFYTFFIVDKNTPLMGAFQKSADMTEGIRWDLFGFNMTMIAIIILGFLALGVGIFAAMPVMWLATAFVYRKLSKQMNKDKAETVPVEETPEK